MKKIVNLLRLGLILSLAGCSTIQYVNTEGDYEGADVESWHHIGVLSLVEFSDPVDLHQTCGEAGWDLVTTERSFPNGLVCAVAGALYCPHTVEVSCSK